MYVSRGTPSNGWGTPTKGTYAHRGEVRRGNGSLVHDGPPVATAQNGGDTVTLTLAAGLTYTVEVAGDTGGTFARQHRAVRSFQGGEPRVAIAADLDQGLSAIGAGFRMIVDQLSADTEERSRPTLSPPTRRSPIL